MEWVALTDKLIKQMEIELVETKFMTHLTGGFFPKWGYPQIIHFDRIFHYKPSILGYPHLWKPPTMYSCNSHIPWLS
jgi:hypothetical protein